MARFHILQALFVVGIMVTILKAPVADAVQQPEITTSGGNLHVVVDKDHQVTFTRGSAIVDPFNLTADITSVRDSIDGKIRTAIAGALAETQVVVESFTNSKLTNYSTSQQINDQISRTMAAYKTASQVSSDLEAALSPVTTKATELRTDLTVTNSRVDDLNTRTITLTNEVASPKACGNVGQVIGPAGCVNPRVVLAGSTSEACTSANVGAMRLNATLGSAELCFNASWLPVGVFSQQG